MVKMKRKDLLTYCKGGFNVVTVKNDFLIKQNGYKRKKTILFIIDYSDNMIKKLEKVLFISGLKYDILSSGYINDINKLYVSCKNESELNKILGILTIIKGIDGWVCDRNKYKELFNDKKL